MIITSVITNVVSSTAVAQHQPQQRPSPQLQNICHKTTSSGQNIVSTSDTTSKKFAITSAITHKFDNIAKLHTNNIKKQ